MAVRLTLAHMGRHHAFDSREHPVIKLGRHGTSHVQLNDPTVSRLHATIELNSREASLVDLGTPRGTQVNGQPVQGRRQLRDGEVISMGGSQLQVGLAPVVDVPIEVPIPDRTVPCQRGVGRDWLAKDYVTHEKYDTHHLVAQMQSERRRRHLALALAFVAVAAVSSLAMIS